MNLTAREPANGFTDSNATIGFVGVRFRLLPVTLRSLTFRNVPLLLRRNSGTIAARRTNRRK